MDIQAFKSGIVEGSAYSYEMIKKAAIWGGRKIQLGFTNYLVPAVKAIWSWSASSFNILKDAVHTGPGCLFAMAAVFFVAGVTAFKIADCKALEDNVCAMTAWKALGIIAFVGTTVAIGFGISTMAV